MSRRTDGVLGLIALGAFVVALAVVDARPSIAFLALGAAGTVGFEILAFRHTETVHRYWNRPIVQLSTLALAFAIVAVGATVAPSTVLSAGIGAIATYLIVLALVLVGAFGTR